MIPPGSTLGVLGGGQLGRMLAHAATRLGYRLHVYEPQENCPAGEVATREFNFAFEDKERLKDFAAGCSAITYEFENVPVKPLWAIEEMVPLRPHWDVLEVCQNRAREKNWLKRNGIPVVPFAEAEVGEDLATAIRQIGMPCIVKTADFGYDGKGQLKVASKGDIPAAVKAFAKNRAVVEGFIDFKCELSVVIARNSEGQMSTFPVAENIHTKHILDFSIVPARIDATVAAKAAKLAENIATAFDLVGLLAIELFMTHEGELLVNEMAPRTHNSGHWSLDACVTSQFEQQVRAITGLPLGSTEMTVPSAVMVNILGDAWKWDGDHMVGAPDWAQLLSEPRAKLHLYGKSEPRPARKMGHFTVTGKSMAKTFDLARKLKTALND